jgi:hypothetical protein
MIRYFFLPLVLSITGGTYTQKNFYDYEATFENTQYLPSIACPSDNNYSYNLECLISYRGTINYDAPTNDVGLNYAISNISFTLTCNVYYVDYTNVPSQRTAILDNSVTLRVDTDWFITPEQYYDQIENTYFTYGLDATTDTCFVQVYYEAEGVPLSPIDETAHSPTLLSSWDNMPSSYLYIDTNSNLFFNQITNFIMNGSYSSSISYENGYADGYIDGFTAGSDIDNTAVTIFSGILNIALVPINFFLAMFNFEILGINMSALVSSILSVCLIVIIVRIIFGKKSGGDD